MNLGSSPGHADSSNVDVAQLKGHWAELIEDMPPTVRAWLADTRPVSEADGVVTVGVPDEFTRSRIEGRSRTMLENSLGSMFGRELRIAFVVEPGLTRDRELPRRESDLTRGEVDDGDFIDRFVDTSTNRSSASSGAAQRQPESHLNPKYLFETFVIGSSNRFAHAAAIAAAEAPGRAYNPLLIYGGSGLGKTHLLHSIGHYVRNLVPTARVRYVSTEEFTNEFINAIRFDKTQSFQKQYRDVDVLLIDDIQFLEGKIQTQEEFFHTFNTLHNANKQIVITSDRPPKQLERLEDRLRNRFEWGLLTDVQPPDLETRIAILRKKAALERLTAPADVLEFIASRIHTNIRELEGALIRVTAFASVNQQPVDLMLTEIVLKDLIPEGTEPEITATLIIAQTASYFGLSIEELISPNRSRNLVNARQIAMYLCRELTPMPLVQVGKEFGGRDHTTVMYANTRIKDQMAENRTTYNTVTELTNRIKQQAQAQQR